jgi:hypothetical protein
VIGDVVAFAALTIAKRNNSYINCINYSFSLADYVAGMHS